MKKYSIRLLSLLLALVMATGMACVVSAEEPGEATCQHTETETSYAVAAPGVHWVVTTCTACGEKAAADVHEDCRDENSDGDCDKCGEAIPVKEDCRHNEVRATYRPAGEGKHFKDLRCAAEGCGHEIQTGIEEACTDEDGDGKCELCYVAEEEEEEEQQQVYLTCAQDGGQTTGTSMSLTFVLHGVETAEVNWTFSASGSAEPSLDTEEAAGSTATVAVFANNGRGVAKVTATATWDGGSVSGAAYVSFYQRTATVFTVKDGEKTFDFMDTGVFEKISGINSGRVDKYSIYSFLTDGCATRVVLYENAKNNADVGVISFQTTGKFYQYDPEDDNDYSIAELGRLNFTPVGEGTYKLNFELYEMADGRGFATTKGTVSIVVGEPGAQEEDLVYRTSGDPVTFDQERFIDFWEENGKSITEELDYVKFPVDERAYGLLYLDKSLRGVVKSNYKFEPNFKATSADNTYDLDDVTYRPDPREDSYTELIEFTAYGKRGTVLKGVITVIVGEELEFTDVKTADWFYEDVYEVCRKGIMNGVCETKFAPNDTLTRGMVVTMLYRMENEPNISAAGTFSDVKAGQWYTEAVEWAAEHDIVEGVGDGKFAPDLAITREQLATILYRYASYEREQLSVGGTDLEQFRDESKVSSWATDAMVWAVHNEIMQGAGGYLSPKDTATRAQAAAMFCRMMDK